MQRMYYSQTAMTNRDIDHNNPTILLFYYIIQMGGASAHSENKSCWQNCHSLKIFGYYLIALSSINCLSVADDLSAMCNGEL